MSLSLSTPSLIATTATTTSDSKIDKSGASDDDSVNPHVSSSMLAVTSTICVVIVLVVAVLVFYIARRRRAKKKSSPLESLRRTALSTRNGVRGSRVRRNGEFGRPNSLLSTSSYDQPKNGNDIYELDPRLAQVEIGLDDQNRSRHVRETSASSSELPPPYGVK